MSSKIKQDFCSSLGKNKCNQHRDKGCTMTNQNCKRNQNKCCNFSEKVEELRKKELSATKIQSVQRGVKVRDNLLKQKNKIKNYKLKDHRKELIKLIKDNTNFKLPENKCDIFESWTEKLKMKGSGATGTVYKLCTHNDCSDKDSKSYVVKIVHIVDDQPEDEDDLYITLPFNSPNRPENYEFYVMDQLKTLVDNKNTPHITYPISFFHCKNSTSGILNKEVIELTEGPSTYSSVLISEWANKGSLKDYMIKVLSDNYKTESKTIEQIDAHNNEIIKNILFQVVYTLQCIKERFPNFRHNDLHLENLLVDEIQIESCWIDEKYFKYTISGKNFYVPNLGFRILLWDYDFANFNNSNNTNFKLYWNANPDNVQGNVSDALLKDQYGIFDKDSHEYDLYFFVNKLFTDLYQNRILTKHMDNFDCLKIFKQFRFFMDNKIIDYPIFPIMRYAIKKKDFVKNYRLSDEYQESDGFMIIKNISNSNIKFNTFDLLTASDLFTDYTEENVESIFGKGYFNENQDKIIEEYSI